MKQFTRTFLFAVAISASLSVCIAQSDLALQFGHLKQPAISNQPNRKMLVVEATGDPNLVGGQAFGLLFQLYYSMEKTPKNSPPPLPRARWPEDLSIPRAQWVGQYALPVPESVSEIPSYQPRPGLKASLVTWEYGEVVEILYSGPYDRESATMEKLKVFARQKGYKTVGGHEEEYIVGPTQNGKGDPEKYLTIIRYKVRKTLSASNLRLSINSRLLPTL